MRCAGRLAHDKGEIPRGAVLHRMVEKKRIVTMVYRVVDGTLVYGASIYTFNDEDPQQQQQPYRKKDHRRTAVERYVGKPVVITQSQNYYFPSVKGDPWDHIANGEPLDPSVRAIMPTYIRRCMYKYGCCAKLKPPQVMYKKPVFAPLKTPTFYAHPPRTVPLYE